MELKAALKILARDYTGFWEGALAITCSEVKLTDEIYEAWKTVDEYLRAERAKEPPPVYPMTEFRKALLEIPTEVLVERLDIAPGMIERYKSGRSAPATGMQELIIRQLAAIV